MNAYPASIIAADAVALRTAGGLRLRVYHDLSHVEHIWRNFESVAVSTFYQSFDWCSLWHKHVGSIRGITPLIVIAETQCGDVQFILPLQTRQVFGMKLVEAYSAQQGAYAFGLFNNHFLEGLAQNWFGQHWPDIIAALPAHDVLRIADAPEAVAGHNNPLLAAGSLYAANITHVMRLDRDLETLMERKRSRETRRTIRKRDNKLESSGDVHFGWPDTDEQITDVLDVMFSDQEKRLAEYGVHHVFSVEERRFIHELAKVRTTSGRLMRPYTLRVDGKIQSVLLGANFNNTYWALIISLAEGPIRRFSPGDYVLRSAFRSLSKDGAKHVDFSAGEAQYKSYWSDLLVPLHFFVKASSFRGLALAGFILAKEKLKRLVKTNPALRISAFRLRRFVLGH